MSYYYKSIIIGMTLYTCAFGYQFFQQKEKKHILSNLEKETLSNLEKEKDQKDIDRGIQAMFGLFKEEYGIDLRKK